MPPRKRTASAAEAPEASESEQPESGAPDQPDADDEAAADAAETEGDDGPARSDLQKVEQPCPECVPNGWPDGAFSVGCTHGTWVRDSA